MSESLDHPSGQLPPEELPEVRTAEAILEIGAFANTMRVLLERSGALRENIGQLSVNQQVAIIGNPHALADIFSYTPKEPSDLHDQFQLSTDQEKVTSDTDSLETDIAELTQRQRRFLHQVYTERDEEQCIDDLTDQQVAWMLEKLIRLYSHRSANDQENYRYAQWMELWAEGMSDATIAQLYNPPSTMFQVRRKVSHYLRQSCSDALKRFLHQVQTTPVTEVPNATKPTTPPARERAPSRSREPSIRTPKDYAASLYQDSELREWIATADNQQIGQLIGTLLDTYLQQQRRRGRPITPAQIARVKDWAEGTSTSRLAARDNLYPDGVVAGRRVVARKLRALDKALREEVLQAIIAEAPPSREPIKEEPRAVGLPVRQQEAIVTAPSPLPPASPTPAQDKNPVERSRLESVTHELAQYLGLSEIQESALLERLQPGILAVDLKVPPKTHEETIGILYQAWTSSFGTFAARSRLSPLQFDIMQRFLGAMRSTAVPLTRQGIEYMLQSKLTGTDIDDEFAHIFAAMLPRKDE